MGNSISFLVSLTPFSVIQFGGPPFLGTVYRSSFDNGRDNCA